MLFFFSCYEDEYYFIFTKNEGKQLAIANTNCISCCCEVEFYFYLYEKKKENNWL